MTTTRTRLSNGLTVLGREVRHAPIITVWVWYRVGGRDEVAGRTGISHWVEHMLFKGTETFRAGDIFRQVTANGGTLNGFTWIDYTTYFETLPADRADLALRIEADRMVNARFDPAEVESERSVIIAEREGHENEPTWHLDEEVTAAAFKVHPYGNGVIGWRCDLETMTRDDLYEHYRRFYHPGNAIVAVVGDFATAEMIERIEHFFGAIPPGPPVPQVRSREGEQRGERRLEIHRPAPHRHLQVAYQAPAASSLDAPAMLVTDAILSGARSMGMGGGRSPMGRSSRLYRALVAAGLTTSARTSFALTRDPFLFELHATLRPNTEPTQVEAVAFEQIEDLARGGPTEEETARARKQLEAQFAYGTESMSSQGYWLGALEVVAESEMLDRLPGAIAAVTPEDVQRVANHYLTRERRTVGWLHPVTSGQGG